MADNQNPIVEMPMLLQWTLPEMQSTNSDKSVIELLKSNDNENNLNNLENKIKMSKTKNQEQTDSFECESLGLTVPRRNESTIISEITGKLNADFSEPVEERNSSKIHNENCYDNLSNNALTVNETYEKIKESSDMTFCETQKLELTSGKIGSQSITQPVEKFLEELSNSEFLEKEKFKGIFDCSKVTINTRVISGCQDSIGEFSTLSIPSNETETKDNAKKVDAKQINELKGKELCKEDQIEAGTLNIIGNNSTIYTEQVNNPSLEVEEEHGKKPFELNKVESQGLENSRNVVVDNVENIFMSEVSKRLLRKRGRKRKNNKKCGSEIVFKKEVRNVETMNLWSERLRPREKHVFNESNSDEEVIVKRKRRGLRKNIMLNKPFNKYEPLQFDQNYETVQFDAHYEPLQLNKPEPSVDDISLQSSFRTRQFLFEIRSLLIKMELTVEDWADGMVTYGNLQTSQLLHNVKNIHSSLEKEFKNISKNLNHILHVDILEEFTELLKKSDKVHCDLRKLMKSIYCRQNTPNLSRGQFSNLPEHIPLAPKNVIVNQLRNLNTQNPRKSSKHEEIHLPLNLSVKDETKTNQVTNLSTNSINLGILSEKKFNCNNLKNNSNYIIQDLSAHHSAQGRSPGVQLFPLNRNNPIQSKFLNQNYTSIFQNSLAYNVDNNNVSVKKGNHFSNYSYTSNQEPSYVSKEGRGRMKKAQPKKQPKKSKSIASSECGGISAAKKPRGKRKTTKSKEEVKNNKKDLRSGMTVATEVEISENIDLHQLSENVNLIETVGNCDALSTADEQNTEIIKSNCEQNLTQFGIDRQMVLDENPLNEILQETNFVKDEIVVELRSKLNRNIVEDVTQLNEKRITDLGKFELTLCTDTHKSEIVIDKSENCQNNRNLEYYISPSIIYYSDDENEVLPPQETGLNNMFILPLTNLSGEKNKMMKKRNNCISCISSLLKNVNDNVPSVNVIPDSEESITKQSDAPNSNISENTNRFCSDAIPGSTSVDRVTSAGFKYNNERPLGANIPSISNEIRCLVSSPSSSNSSNLKNIYAQKSMTSSLMNAASSSLTNVSTKNSSNSLNNTTNRNPTASNSLNNTTNINLTASNSLNNITNRNPTTSNSLNNIYSKNPSTSRFLENNNSVFSDVPRNLNGTLSMKPTSSSSLNDNGYSKPSSSLPDAPSGWDPSYVNKRTSAENIGAKDPTMSLKDTILSNSRCIIHYAPGNSKGSNHSNFSSSQLKNMKNFDFEPSSLKNVFKNTNNATSSLSNLAQSSSSCVPSSLYYASNNIPFDCEAQRTTEENTFTSKSASALNSNLKETIVICNSKEDATSTIMSLVDNKPNIVVSNNQNKFNPSSQSDSSKIIYNEGTLLRSSEKSESVSYSFKRKERKNIPTCNDIVKNKNIPSRKTVKNKIKENTSKSVTLSNNNLMKKYELQKKKSNKTDINANESSRKYNNKKFTTKCVIDKSEISESNEHFQKFNIFENNTTDQSLKQSSTENSLQQNHTGKQITNQGKHIKQNEPIMNTEQFLDTCNTEFINTNEQNARGVNLSIQNIRTRRVKSKGEYLQIEDFSDLYAQNIFIW